MKKVLLYASAILLIGFGLLTLFLSSSVIFDLFGIREKEGNYVLFIVWANFVSSIIYLIAGYGFIKHKSWTAKILALSFLLLLIAFIGLIVHVNSGGIHETKTIGAMMFRTSLAGIFALVAYFTLSKKRNSNHS